MLADLEWTEGFGYTPPESPEVTEPPADAGDLTIVHGTATVVVPEYRAIPFRVQVAEVARVLQTSDDRSLVRAVGEYMTAYKKTESDLNALTAQLLKTYGVVLIHSTTALQAKRVRQAAKLRRDCDAIKQIDALNKQYMELRQQLSAGIAAANQRISELRSQFAEALSSAVWRELKIDGKIRFMIQAGAGNGYINNTTLTALETFSKTEAEWFDQLAKLAPKQPKHRKPGSASRRHRRLYPDGKAPLKTPKKDEKKGKSKKGR